MPHELKWELYNIAEDRCEMHDLAGEQPDRVNAMTAEWEKWARHVGVIWEPAADTTEGPAAVTQKIANRPLKIHVEVEAPQPSGVVLAQGGNQHGFAVHFVDGRPAFDVRVKGVVRRVAAERKVSGSVILDATLSAESMTLSVNSGPAISGPSPGLIPVQPIDGLSVGFDDKSAAGDYQSPNRFTGKINSYKVQVSGEVSAVLSKEDAHSLRESLSGTGEPLFTDLNYNGSCDPEVVWNPAAKEWFIYYTARRATRSHASYVGTPLGVISSPDLSDWTFRGYCSFDGKQGQTDNDDTHWAPGIVVSGRQLHMFATYKASAKPPWGGDGVIRHYVAPLDDPVSGWRLWGVPGFNQPDPIDVSVLNVAGGFRAYYRVGENGGIQWASSDDLVHWANHGPCPGDLNSPNRGYGYQEAPYVFRFQNRYWMLTDPHDGLAVFHSPDGISWTQQERILRTPGTRKADATLARHPSVAVVDGRAFIFYHTEPNRPYPSPPPEQRTVAQKISFLQMAELKVHNGVLVSDRNAAISFDDMDSAI